MSANVRSTPFSIPYRSRAASARGKISAPLDDLRTTPRRTKVARLRYHWTIRQNWKSISLRARLGHRPTFFDCYRSHAASARGKISRRSSIFEPGIHRGLKPRGCDITGRLDKIGNRCSASTAHLPFLQLYRSRAALARGESARIDQSDFHRRRKPRGCDITGRLDKIGNRCSAGTARQKFPRALPALHLSTRVRELNFNPSPRSRCVAAARP